jgi:hypothetical protein
MEPPQRWRRKRESCLIAAAKLPPVAALQAAA